MLLTGMGIALAGSLEGNYYADLNKELFITPKSSSMAGSDASLSRSAQPLSNPANLSVDSISRVELAYAGFYRNTFSNSSLSYIGGIDPSSSFSISISYNLVPDIAVIDSGDYEPKDMANASELFFRVGYGRKIVTFKNRLDVHVGAAMNGIRKNLIDLTGYGLGLDAGVNVYAHTIGVGASLIIDNITTSYMHWTSSYQEFAYPHAKLGIGWEKEFPYIYGRLSVAYLSPDMFSNEGINSYGSDTMNTDDGSSSSSVSLQDPQRLRVLKHPSIMIWGRYGAEYIIMNRIAFRMGYSLITSSFTFGAGLGLLDNRAGIDFAYLTHELAPTYKLSVNYKWL